MKVVCVSFNYIKQLYIIDDNIEVKKDQFCAVNTQYGVHVGKILNVKNNYKINQKQVFDGELRFDLTKEEIEKSFKNKTKANQILTSFKDYLSNDGIDINMNLISASISLDAKIAVIFFASDFMIDFRSLLSYANKTFPEFKFRLENIGDSRYKSKFLGGIGICGQMLCCLKMDHEKENPMKNQIKNQGLSPNPINHLGQCNKLKCCLNFEDNIYLDIKKELPLKNSFVKYEKEKYQVIKIKLLKKELTLEKVEKESKDKVKTRINVIYDPKIITKL